MNYFCNSVSEVDEVIQQLDKKNIQYEIYENEEKMFFSRGHRVQFIVRETDVHES